jgi:hypothetical protein
MLCCIHFLGFSLSWWYDMICFIDSRFIDIVHYAVVVGLDDRIRFQLGLYFSHLVLLGWWGMGWVFRIQVRRLPYIPRCSLAYSLHPWLGRAMARRGSKWWKWVRGRGKEDSPPSFDMPCFNIPIVDIIFRSISEFTKPFPIPDISVSQG